MTHFANRHHLNPHHGEPRAYHEQHSTQRNRHIGVGTLNRVGVDRPAQRGNWHLTPNQELLSSGVHDVVKARIKSVLEYNVRDGGHTLDRDEDTVYLAYAAQTERVSDQDIVDDMTFPELTTELIAQAVLYAPTMSDALGHPYEHKHKLVFAEFDDIIKRIVAVAKPRDIPDIITVLKERSEHIGTSLGHNGSLVSKKGYVESLFKGERAELAIQNAVHSDPTLEGFVPEDEDADTRGVDFVVGKKGSGELINIDIKSHGSYIIHVKELRGYGKDDYIDLNSADSIYCFTGIDEYGRRHYLLNANAEVFGDIQTTSNEYNVDGQKRVVQAIHAMVAG